MYSRILFLLYVAVLLLSQCKAVPVSIDPIECPHVMDPPFPNGPLQTIHPCRKKRESSESFPAEKPRFRVSAGRLCQIRFHCSRVGCVPFCKT